MNSSDSSKNIVLITFDSLRADHCGFMGYTRNVTPNIDRLAEDGVAFEKALSPASRTNASMSAIFTGKDMVIREKISDPKNSRQHIKNNDTIAESLNGRGYRTGAFCPNAYASSYYGFDKGFDHFEDFLFDSGTYRKLFSKHIDDSDIYTILRNMRNFVRREEAFRTWDTYLDQMVDWVEKQSPPFFLWAFSLDTHFPYISPRNHREWGSLFKMYYYNWFCNRIIDDDDVNLTKKQKQAIIDIYDDSIHFADELVAELRDRLTEYDPVFVVHADHGEAFGEHGMYGHFFPSLYPENTHVPLVISGGGVDSGQITKPVSLQALPSILRGIAGGTLSIEKMDFGPATMSAYDGRRDRNLVGTAIENTLHITEVSNGQINEQAFIFNSNDKYYENIPLREISDSLREDSLRRILHESEIGKLKNAISTINE